METLINKNQIRGEWQKPADWIDIRSGALDNSVYFLVAHSKPTESGGVYSIATYPKFSIYAGVSTSANTYDVFVDGIKVATTAHNTATEIDWATLYNNGTLQGGYDVMHPSELTTHVVRVTPSVATDTLTQIHCSGITGQTQQGILWVHFEIDYATRIVSLLSGESSPRNTLCEAITARNDTLKFAVASTGNTGLYQVGVAATSLVKLPILEAENNTNIITSYLSFSSVPAKKIVIKNNSEKTRFQILHNFLGETLETENPLCLMSGFSSSTATGARNIKKLPAISTTEKGTTLIMDRLDSIEETFIDESFNDKRTLLRIDGASGHQTNLIGLVVSPEAPFDYATAPQLSVNYTNMDRAALVRLFKSLPYNVGYEVVGSPTITDGVASGFSASDYLQLPKLPEFNDIELVFLLKSGWQKNVANLLFFCSGKYFITIEDNNQIQSSFLNSLTQQRVVLRTTDSIDNVSDIFVKIHYSNNYQYIATSSDGSSWNILASSEESFIGASSDSLALDLFHNSGGAYFRGSIGLSQTNIKLNNLLWFRGTAAMTKSISVVGCTGTPDLTAEDKAIAEDKNWSIVLS